MVGNTGTYIDSPFHRYADGDDVADFALAAIAALDAVVVRVPAVRPGDCAELFYVYAFGLRRIAT